MKSKNLFYFAEKSDLHEIITQFEEVESVSYFQTGLFEEKSFRKLNSLLDYPALGNAFWRDWNFADSFLIVPKEQEIEIREIPQYSGGVKYAVDQKENKDSIIFRLGGTLREGVLIGGNIGTISKSETSLRYFKQISKCIKREFKKIQEFYVSKNSQQLLSIGWRLTVNERTPIEYDFKIP